MALAGTGASFNDREMRLPASPVGFVRFAVESWNEIGGLDFGLIAGGAAAAIIVDQCKEGGECADEGSATDFLATAEIGLAMGLAGEPYFVGFFGRAFPSTADRFNPFGSNAERRYRFYTWGAGAGISPRVGRLSFTIEARWRRDERFAIGYRNSVEVILGFPFRSS